MLPQESDMYVGVGVGWGVGGGGGAEVFSFH